MAHKDQSIQGYSLISVLIAMTLAALLASLAAPSFSGLVEQAELRRHTDQLYQSLRYARSEALVRGQSVTIAARDKAWTNGWKVFVDRNQDGHQQAREPLLREVAALPSAVRLSANSGIGEQLHYQPDGRAQRPSGSLQMGTFRLCNSGTAARGDGVYALVLSANGRVRVEPQAPSSSQVECTVP